MERIYYTKFRTDTLEEAMASLFERTSALENAIASHSFLAAQSNNLSADFLTLAALCHELAADEDAEIEILTDNAQTAQILLTAPCFLFQCHQFVLWQKITLLASEIVFDTAEENQSQITVIFDFSNAELALYRQLKKHFSE